MVVGTDPGTVGEGSLRPLNKRVRTPMFGENLEGYIQYNVPSPDVGVVVCGVKNVLEN